MQDAPHSCKFSQFRLNRASDLLCYDDEINKHCNLQISRAPLIIQAQGTSLFTSSVFWEYHLLHCQADHRAMSNAWCGRLQGGKPHADKWKGVSKQVFLWTTFMDDHWL